NECAEYIQNSLKIESTLASQKTEYVANSEITTRMPRKARGDLGDGLCHLTFGIVEYDELESESCGPKPELPDLAKINHDCHHRRQPDNDDDDDAHQCNHPAAASALEHDDRLPPPLEVYDDSKGEQCHGWETRRGEGEQWTRRTTTAATGDGDSDRETRSVRAEVGKTDGRRSVAWIARTRRQGGALDGALGVADRVPGSSNRAPCHSEGSSMFQHGGPLFLKSLQ
ncbi:hypothetical protein CPC08DRAFT_731507, partial [Agrocybe pediades]